MKKFLRELILEQFDRLILFLLQQIILKIGLFVFSKYSFLGDSFLLYFTKELVCNGLDINLRSIFYSINGDPWWLRQ